MEHASATLDYLINTLIAHYRAWSVPQLFYYLDRIERCTNDMVMIFSIYPQLSYGDSIIKHVQIHSAVDNRRLTVTAQFDGFSLLGAQGVLPDHYIELLMKRVATNDRVLLDFINIFSQRIVELYYQAWCKSCERRQELADGEDNKSSVTSIMSSLIHRAFGSNIIKHQRFYYSMIPLGHGMKAKSSLQQRLHHYFNLPIKISDDVGCWRSIGKDNHTRIASKMSRQTYNSLGLTTYLGVHYWDRQSQIIIHIGPVDNKTLHSRLLGKRLLYELRSIVKSFVDLVCDIRIKVDVLTHTFPKCYLLKDSLHPIPRLGWNTLLLNNDLPLNKFNTITLQGNSLFIDEHSAGFATESDGGFCRDSI